MDFLIIYLLVVNLLLFCLMGIDKYKAKKRKWRIKEFNLILLGIVGGCVGGLLGMYFFKHKTKKGYFKMAYIGSFLLYVFIYFWFIRV